MRRSIEMVEHKCITANQPASPENLDDFAKEGWEFVQIFLWNKEYLHYFRREKLDG